VAAVSRAGPHELPMPTTSPEDCPAANHPDEAAERVLRPARGAKPAIRLATIGGRKVVIKDFSANPWMLRQIYGRWVVARECRIYGLLDGVQGVPAFRGRLGPFAFAVDYIEGSSLKGYPRRSLPAEVFERLARLQDAIHARGVVHLDCHQKKNVLLDSAGRPYLVDFAASVCVGRGWFGRRVLLPLLSRADRLGLHKLRDRYCAEEPDARERLKARLLRLAGLLWPFTAARRLRRWVRKRAQRRAAQRTGPAD